MDRNVTLSSDAKGIYGRIVPGLDVLLAGSAATLGTPQSIQYGAAIIHAVDHHTVNVVAPQDCRHYLWLGVSTKPDPHVAGTGVLVAFLISAWSMFILALVAYITGCLSAPVIRSLDEHLFAITSRRVHTRYARSLTQIMSVLSDIQLVLGIVVLFSALLNLDSIANYHYNIAIYLSWLSLSTSLLSLLLFQHFLRSSPPHLLLRLTGTTILFIILLVSQLPTTTTIYHTTISSFPTRPTSGIPASCFWKALPSSPSPKNAPHIIALLALTLSFTWRLISLFPSPRHHLLYILKDWPHALLVWLTTRILRYSPVDPTPASRVSPGRLPRVLLFKITTTLLVLHYTLFEILESFTGALLMLATTAAWATVNLLLLKRDVGAEIRSAEHAWTVTSGLAVALLFLPLAKGVEVFFGRREVARQDGQERDEEIGKQEGKLAQGVEIEQGSLAVGGEGDEESKGSTLQTFSEALLSRSDGSEDERVHDGFLHGTRFFRSLVYLLYALLLGTMLWQVVSMAVFQQGEDWTITMMWFAGCLGLIAVHCLAGWWCSRVFQ